MATMTDPLSAARALRTTINAVRHETEAARRLPTSVVDELIEAGLCRLTVPEEPRWARGRTVSRLRCLRRTRFGRSFRGLDCLEQRAAGSLEPPSLECCADGALRRQPPDLRQLDPAVGPSGDAIRRLSSVGQVGAGIGL